VIGVVKGIVPVVMAAVVLAGASQAQEEMGLRQQRGRALEGMIQSSGDESLRHFAETQLAPGYRAGFSGDALIEHLRRIREAAHGFGGVLADLTDDGGTRLTFVMGAGEVSVVFHTQPDAPNLIVALELETPGNVEGGAPIDGVPPYTWDTLAQRLDAEARDGFAGSVLVVHDGAVVLHEGYGLADRTVGVPVGPETIFAIGSVPIDFTKAAILKLEDTGKLSTSDPITKFLDSVPADKRTMTIDHLMTGRSGLPDFFHIPGVDADPDLSWIDRATALDRIMGQELLFAPGSDEAHSHAAWVLLAAIVELVSGQSYGDYLEHNFFEPAGMTRTGLHEDMERFSDHDLAVGYEGQSYGKVNTPRYWGRTSWLVMGSGGMASTTGDLYRWITAIRGGKTLSPRAARKFWSHMVLAGGDDRGFFCLYTEGPGDLMIMCSNVHTRRGDLPSQVGRRLVELVVNPDRN
jgi:CubicO group peptidase (beta-lactamase class C family)